MLIDTVMALLRRRDPRAVFAQCGAGVALAVALLATAVAVWPERPVFDAVTLPVVDQARAQAGAANLRELRLALGGTVAQRRAGERLAYRRMVAVRHACLRSFGAEPVPVAEGDWYEAVTDADLDGGLWDSSGWLSPPGDTFGVNQRLLRHSTVTELRTGRREPTAADPAAPAMGDVVTEPVGPHLWFERFCREQAGWPGYPGDRYDEYRSAATGVALNTELVKAVVPVLDHPTLTGLIARYPQCLQDSDAIRDRAGYQWRTVRSPSDLRRQLRNAGPSTQDLPILGRPAGPTWTTAVDLERRAAQADAHCRRHLHGQAMALAAPILDRFAADNADRIRQTQQEWQHLVHLEATGR